MNRRSDWGSVSTISTTGRSHAKEWVLLQDKSGTARDLDNNFDPLDFGFNVKTIKVAEKLFVDESCKQKETSISLSSEQETELDVNYIFPQSKLTLSQTTNRIIHGPEEIFGMDDDPINGQESANRFAFLTESEVSKEMEVSVPNNTKRKATWAYNLYCSWKTAAQHREFSPSIKRALERDILNLVDEELNLLLPLFFTTVQRQDDEEYQSDSIFYIACGLVKYFEINGKNFPLLSGEQFKSVRNVISNTMRKKVVAGIGLFKKKADPISPPIEEQLWENFHFGTDTPQKLLRTMFWLIGVNFGLRGGQEPYHGQF
ncbi:Hypothetical predicted protein [Mytilus galloprovincialis]|uniref:QRICH1-like domain-containing protein n=1 Tax=Mytilus galloprovincialis TaxID=29158 RepID=A0A8B6DJS0_MYTGA|nr:Hypothetical predicted protein [Mytilus galloprovincialis]